MRNRINSKLMGAFILITIVAIILIYFIKNDMYQVSNLKLENKSTYYPKITGAFKNNSSHYCESVWIYVEINSGTLKTESTILLSDVKPGVITEINSLCINCQYINDKNNVEVKVKKIECDK